MKYGLVDADLITRGTNMPNLALMKISAHLKEQGHDVILLDKYEDVDKCFCSKVFDFNNDPDFIGDLESKGIEVTRGGTGYGLWGQKYLPDEIEHHMPDYHLYDKYWETHSLSECKTGKIDSSSGKLYRDYSIGFTTRGCIRHCPFCVNRDSNGVVRWSPVKEFLDVDRPKICLEDDNILAYPKWNEIFAELQDTGKKYKYQQGMDIRLMTPEKAKVLGKSRYDGNQIFAFDNIKDTEIIERGFRIYRDYCNKGSTAYVLTGYYDHTIQEIKDLITRANILKKYNVNPYVMIHKDYVKNPYREIVMLLKNFCNFVPTFKKQTFDEYLNTYSKSYRIKVIYQKIKFKELEEFTGRND